MDDGALTALGFLTGRPTGNASKTVSDDFHKPGRGAGNSINALLDAWSLSGERRYLRKAEELLERCIHPRDDVPALGLDAPEYRWSYLVFLQVVGKYLDLKLELGETDYGFYYARDSLLHYAEWMLVHEVPYRDVLHKVELPTETWPAHDIRKCHVMHLSAKYAAGDVRADYRRRAAFFFDRCLTDLLGFETAYLTRPQVLLCVYGHVHGYFLQQNYSAEVHSSETAAHGYSFGEPVNFMPQRAWVSSGLGEKKRILRAEFTRIWRGKLAGLRRRFRRPAR